MTLPKLPFRLAEIPYSELIFEGEIAEPVYLWAPALPAIPLTIKWVDSDGQEHINGVAVTRNYLENVKAEHDRYIEALEERGCTGLKGRRPIVDGTHDRNVFDEGSCKEYGYIVDTRIAEHDGVDCLWLKLAVTKPLPTRRISIDIEPFEMDSFTGLEFGPFIHHLLLTSFPKIKNVEIPDDPAVWEAAGLRLSEIKGAPKMQTEKPTPQTPVESPVATNEEPSPQTPVEPPVATNDPGEEAPVTRAEFERVLTLMEQIAEQKEQPVSTPIVPPEEQRIAASEERLARLEKRLEKFTTLPTREAGGGQVPPSGPVVIANTSEALRLSEEKLRATGKAFSAVDTVLLSRRLKGEALDASDALRLSELGV